MVFSFTETYIFIPSLPLSSRIIAIACDGRSMEWISRFKHEKVQAVMSAQIHPSKMSFHDALRHNTEITTSATKSTKNPH